MSKYQLGKYLYKSLPNEYLKRDEELRPHPYSTKKLFQIADVGYSEIEKEIDIVKNLYEIYLQSEEVVDLLLSNMGFQKFTYLSLQEKQIFLYNLPEIIRNKGNDSVYNSLAHVFFHRDAKTSARWEYEDFEDYGERTVIIDLQVPDTVIDFDKKREKFLELVEYFRAINVKIGWNIAVFYDYVVRLVVDDSYSMDYINMDDNFGKFEYDVLNKGKLPFTLFSGNFQPEKFDMRIMDDEDREIVNNILEDGNNLGVEDEDFIAFSDKDMDTSIMKLIDNDFVTRTDYRNMLNMGKLNSTITLNELPKVITE